MMDGDLSLIVAMFTITWLVLGWMSSEMYDVNKNISRFGQRLATVETTLKFICGDKCDEVPDV